MPRAETTLTDITTAERDKLSTRRFAAANRQLMTAAVVVHAGVVAI
jgi:hypothetical protein